jgi:hypothetical protein
LDGYVVDVDRGAHGGQQLRVRKIGNKPNQLSTTYGGSSHRQFWDFFYRAVGPLSLIVPPQSAAALAPIGGDPVWLITNRNSINYDTYRAITMALDFQGSFATAGFPTSLPTVLGTLYNVFEALLVTSFDFARQLALRTDALAGLNPTGLLGTKIRKLVYGPRAPNLISRTKKQVLIV